MTKGLGDLNDILFAQLDRLSKDGIGEDELAREITRTQAIVSASGNIIQNANTRLAAARLYAEHGAHILEHLPEIGRGTDRKALPKDEA